MFMVILMVGESKIGAKLREKFEKENHRVLMAADAEEVGKLLQREEQIDLFVAAPSFIDGLSEEEAEGLSAGMKSGVSAEADTDTGAVLGVKDDADISAGPDWEKAERLYDTCVIEPLSALQKAYSCLERGSLKRICYLNPVCGSINASLEGTGYGVSMCACAVNMQVSLLFNRLRPLGYTFRLFGTRQDRDAAGQADAAYWYFVKDRSVDPESAKHEDENRLVMRDPDGREIPF